MSQVTRMCIACRSILPQERLWRFIRSLDGVVLWDSKQILPSRGAYTCQNSKCFQQATDKKAFTRAFKKTILSISIPNGESTGT